MENQKKKKLTIRQEAFCQNFCSPDEFFGNGVQSYIDAYSIDVGIKGQYNVARVGAHDNLTKPAILHRIDELLSNGGLNDQHVDKQLHFLITQKAEMGTSLGAIKEYNKLKGRITEKIEHKGLVLKIESDDPKDQKTIDDIG